MQQQHSDNAWWHHKLWQLRSMLHSCKCTYTVELRCQLMRDAAEMDLKLDVQLESDSESMPKLKPLLGPLALCTFDMQVEFD